MDNFGGTMALLLSKAKNVLEKDGFVEDCTVQLRQNVRLVKRVVENFGGITAVLLNEAKNVLDQSGLEVD